MIDADLAREIVAERAPCTGCHFAQRCRDERLCCAAFAMYASSASPARWEAAARAPTRARWEALFGE